MSPEQARGKPVDKRSDVWAFGCVLYEMLTGRSAFSGDTISDTIAAILGREPEWSSLKTPASLRRVLQRCLDKDPRRRFHDIADVRIEIEDVMSGAADTVADATGARTVNAWRRPVRLLASVAAVVALVVVGALTWSLLKSAPTTAPPRISRMTIASSGTAALGIADDRSLAMTPDGTRVVYVGINNQLMVHALDRLDSTAIYTGAAPLNWVFVSPDGRWVGFAEGRLLRKVAITGGPADTIAQANLRIGGTWAPDDSIIFAASDEAAGLRRVSANGGNVEVLTRPAQARGERYHLWPEMLPGGRAVLFTITATTGGLAASQVAILDLGTRDYRVLVRGGSHAHYVPSGHLVYTAEGTLRAVPFDLARLEAGTMPVTVTAAAGDNAARRRRFRRGRRRNPRLRGRARCSIGGGSHSGVGGSPGRGGVAGSAPAPLLPTARVAGRGATGGRYRGPGVRHLGVGLHTPNARPPDVRSRT